MDNFTIVKSICLRALSIWWLSFIVFILYVFLTLLPDVRFLIILAFGILLISRFWFTMTVTPTESRSIDLSFVINNTFTYCIFAYLPFLFFCPYFLKFNIEGTTSSKTKLYGWLLFVRLMMSRSYESRKLWNRSSVSSFFSIFWTNVVSYKNSLQGVDMVGYWCKFHHSKSIKFSFLVQFCESFPHFLCCLLLLTR